MNKKIMSLLATIVSKFTDIKQKRLNPLPEKHKWVYPEIKLYGTSYGKSTSKRYCSKCGLVQFRLEYDYGYKKSEWKSETSEEGYYND